MRDLNQRPATSEEGFSESILPVDPRRIIGIFRRRATLILALAVAGVLIALPPEYRDGAAYQSTAVIRARDARQAVTGGLAGEPEMQIGPLVDPMLSLIEVFRSRGVAGIVVDSIPVLRLRSENVPITILKDVSVPDSAGIDTLNLEFWESGVRLAGAPPDSAVEYGTPLVTPNVTFTVARRPESFDGLVTTVTREPAIDALLLKLNVVGRPSTAIINVRYTAPDSALARDVANKLVLAFRAIDAEMAQEVSRARSTFLASQLEQSEGQLAEARDALTDFRASQRSFSARDRFSAQEAGVSALSSRRAELDAQRRLYRTLLARLAEPNGTGNGISALLSSPGLSDNPVIRQTADQLARYEA